MQKMKSLVALAMVLSMHICQPGFCQAKNCGQLFNPW